MEINIYVVVGASGVLLTSPTGVTWTQRSIPVVSTLNNVLFAGGQFIASGNSAVILTSPDGINWTQRTSNAGTTSLHGIAYKSGTYVVVGNQGTIISSPDGINWTVRTSGTLTNFFPLEATPTSFVASGQNAYITTSPDGITWTAQNSGMTNAVFGLTYANPHIILAAANMGAIRTSVDDGVTWTAQTSGSSITFNGSATNGSMFAVVGFSGTILTSVNQVLPMRFLSFSVTIVNNKRLVQWQTASENNISHFEIEKSNDGITFSSIGNVAATNTNSTHRYQFQDPTPLSRVNFYRIRQLDEDGRYYYSSVIRSATLQENNLAVYPNPATDVIYIDSKNNTEQFIITNATGQQIQTGNLQTGNAVSISQLKPGIYYLKMGTETIRFLKQ